MKRRLLLAVGAFDMLMVVGFALLGAPNHLDQAVGMVLFVAAGVLFVAAGLRDSVTIGSKTVRWHALAGVAYICFGIGMLVRHLPTLDGTRGDVAVIVVLVPMMLFMGVDFLRGGVHLDISKWD